MTRVCRARFEQDDKLEARIVCDSKYAAPDSMEDTELSDLARGIDNANANPNFSLSRLWRAFYRLRTSRTPLHATSERPQDPEAEVQHNPFNSSDDPSSPLSYSAPSTLPEKCQAPSPMPPVDEWGVADMTASPEMLPTDSMKSFIVTAHPPHPAWDDEPSPDHPYDIPYYNRPIEEFLWLPRNPLGTLNLDETVNMRTPLTSQAIATAADASRDDVSVRMLSPDNLSTRENISPRSTLRQLTGTEQIELPVDIEIRVNDLKQEDGVESTSRSRRSLFTRRASTYTVNEDRLVPSLLRGRARQPRSLSLGADLTAAEIAGPSTSLSSGRHRRNRSVTLDYELGLRSQAQLASRSAIFMHEHSPSPSLRHAISPAKRAQSPASISVTTRDAVVGEAIAEEQQAAEEQLRRDEVEEERAHETRPWLTAWMFAKDQ